MKLFELEYHIKSGGGVRRKVWEDKHPTLYFEDRWSIIVDSLFANDWFAIEEEK